MSHSASEAGACVVGRSLLLSLAADGDGSYDGILGSYRMYEVEVPDACV